ncbi:MAG: epoxide hydrolase [Chitinophagaceae bacterium]|nr:epoxide hydrolase [Chitinophagaceae bacterium]
MKNQVENQKQIFRIDIGKSVLDDLRSRLANTRWPDQVENAGWNYGTNKEYLEELCDHWLHRFNWKDQEEYLNSFPQFKVEIDDTHLHFLHIKGEGKKNIPLLLTHGYPDNFIRFLKLIPLLTKADSQGLAFDLIIPGIPGFGFSSIPSRAGMNTERIAAILAALMHDVLGYEKFVAHGGDWGSSITEQLALHHKHLLTAIHMTEIPFRHLFTIQKDELTEPEKKYLQAGRQWQQKEGAYALIQGTKPQSLAYGLNDSPAGLAGWIIEKFQSWSDCDGHLDKVFTKDELLTNITIYWITQTINSAFRLYYEAMQEVSDPSKNPITKVAIPTAIAIFPKDMVPAPREYADRIFNIQQWTNMPHGGHFAAMEAPELLANDIRKFVSGIVEKQH